MNPSDCENPSLSYWNKIKSEILPIKYFWKILLTSSPPPLTHQLSLQSAGSDEAASSEIHKEGLEEMEEKKVVGKKLILGLSRPVSSPHLH